MTIEGVNISVKEIYDMLLQSQKAIDKIELQIAHIEDLDERCRQAVIDGQKAIKMMEDMKTARSYMYQIVIGAVITGIVSVIIYILSGGKVQ